jgi:general stress protein 26
LLAPVLACAEATPPRQEPREPTRQNVISAARQIMRSARFCALATVDGEGRPRARTLAPFPPLEDMTVWFATRHATRKVEQIRAHPDVTLYYFDPQRLEYATILGRARLVDELEQKQRWRDRIDGDLYPGFPEDCLLVEVTPVRLEVLGRGLVADPDTWQPPGIDFD